MEESSLKFPEANPSLSTKITIDQAMQQAIANHKQGKLKEAKAVYKEVLKVVPSHPDANHNLGALLVALHQSNHALNFLQTALQLNEQVEQFWLSYIDALINLDDLYEANSAISKAKNFGFSGVKFEILEERILSPSQLLAKGKLFRARDGNYLGFLRALHENVYEGYFEIGARTGSSLSLSQSPSIAIDPFFQLKEDPIGNKEYCLMFQETSDSFFEKRVKQLQGLKCQLAFIDGMHLFEQALKDFLNLAKISTERSLFLFHDPIPWTLKMATRNNGALERNEAWTGDIWKLVHIFIDAGLKENLSLLSSAPSGLLAVLNPKAEAVEKLEKNFSQICARWLEVELSEDTLLNFYETGLFTKPEAYLQSLANMSFGNKEAIRARDWVSQ